MRTLDNASIFIGGIILGVGLMQFTLGNTVAGIVDVLLAALNLFFAFYGK